MWSWRTRTEEDFAEEIRANIALETDRLIATGMTPKEARGAARRVFGNVTRAQERFYGSRRMMWLDDLRRDINYAVRTLFRNPGFTIVVLLTLALGIGANTAIFAVANAVLLKPLSLPAPERVVRLRTIAANRPSALVGAQQFEFWRSQSELFDEVSAHRLEFVNVTGGVPEHVPIARVSASFFPLFGARFVEGRTFSADEDRPGGAHVAVLGYQFWTRRFARDPEIVGKAINLGSAPHTIIGVLTAQFDSEQFEITPDVWVPLQYDVHRIDAGNLSTVTARLKAGVTPDIARARLEIADSDFLEYRVRLTSQRIVPGSLSRSDVQPLLAAMVGDTPRSLMLLAGSVGFVLLIACANVANLLLARGSHRKREIAVRAALGAGRGRIIRALVTESAVLSVTGGALGLLISAFGVRMLLALYPGYNPTVLERNLTAVPRAGESAIALAADWRVLTFTLLLSCVTPMLFGLFPAWQCARIETNEALKRTGSSFSAGFHQGRVRGLLVVGELALAFVLVVGAALLIRTLQAYLAVDTGFDSTNVISMRMALGGTRFETRAGMEVLTKLGAEHVRALPGVVNATTACCMPLETVWQLPFVMQSRAGEGLTRSGNLAFHGFAGWSFISPGYFDVLKVPITRGRDFTEADTPGAPGVVIINETMARLFWKEVDPLSDRLTLGRGMRPEYNEDPVRQIIGIVHDIRTQGLTRPPRPEMYVPVAQVPDGVTALNVKLLPIVWLARTQRRPFTVVAGMSRELEQVSGLAVSRVRSLREVVAESTGRTRFDMWLMILFAAFALLLAVIGVFGITAFSVQSRTHDIGIRMALGALPAQVQRSVFLRSLGLIVAGVTIGAVTASALSRWISSLLFGVTALDPVVFATVTLLLISAATTAAWISARRATRIDPLVALRCE
jgi:putative ABC transport system permease protein